MVMAIKTHGHVVGRGSKVPRDQGQVNFNDMAEVNHTAILIIRNPFKALIGTPFHYQNLSKIEILILFNSL